MGARERGAAALITVTLAFAVLALGSGPRWAVCATALLCLACAVPWAWSRRRLSPMPHLLVLLGLATGFTAIQLLPLPMAVLELISPARAALVVDNAAAWNAEPAALAALRR
jgi:hypothetical protein